MREHDHDLLGHGWRWNEAWHQTRDEERENLHRAIASFERVLGSRPVGWNCRSWPSENTRDLLVEEGGFIYDSDVCADDIPYYASHGGQPWLVVPYSKTYNDSRFVTNPGFASPRDFVETTTMGLDQLVYERRAAMMTVAVHARWSGQAGRAAALREIIAYAQKTPGVAFMRREDIARWWLERYPPQDERLMAIDLRSDTATRPSPRCARRWSSAEVGDEQRGEDPTVNALEQLAAELLGQEAAVYLPTATMGNQIAVPDPQPSRRGDPGRGVIARVRRRTRRGWPSTPGSRRGRSPARRAASPPPR